MADINDSEQGGIFSSSYVVDTTDAAKGGAFATDTVGTLSGEYETTNKAVLIIETQLAEAQATTSGYLDDAETAATNAANSATAAANSATAASDSEDAAATSESNASTSESNASTSATNAANSATAAAGSATTATTKASEAATSASNAATSESNAATSEGNAANSATAAAGSATSASTSATNAATSASSASAAQTAAEFAQSSVETLFEQFGDQYLGSHADDTAVATYASSNSYTLDEGDIYWDSTDNVLKFYTGSAWVAPEDIASTAATNASNSATAAASSATAAATSATSAAGSASTATTKASEASTSAFNAASSESAAATSESNAATSASNAATSASNAATSEGNAATSEGNAATSESNAATSESNASTSASNAATSASSASGSATTATTQASNASTSAIAAAASASAASTSATNAATSASAAADSETNAATSESNASTSASNAATSASNAATSETNAATSESNASTSETNAAGSATAAASSATSAASNAISASSSAAAAAASETAAAASAASAAATYDGFDDRYLGAKSSAPATDNDGNALIIGALYFNTTDGVMNVYTASGWVPASSSLSAVFDQYYFTATSGQTVFSGTDDEGNTFSCSPAYVIVTLNGIVLEATNDYTVTSSAVTLTSGATTGDELNVVAFGPVAIADVYVKADSDARYLLDSEVTNLAAVKSFDPTDYATAAQGALADSALQSIPDNYILNTGDSITGNLDFGDNVRARFGTSQDLQIYHDGSDSYIGDFGTGNLKIQGASRLTIGSTSGEEFIVGNNNDSVELKFNNSTKLATTSTGINVTGTVAATSYTGDGSALTGIDALPSQSGESGNFLTTDGTTASWTAIDTGNTADVGWENPHTITTNYTITTGNNMVSAGPLTISTGSVTVPSGSTWTIV
jgi:hypothetical protein